MARIRLMNAEEVRQLVAWAGVEGWNPGIHDAEAFWSLDPDGFLAITEDASDEVLGGGAIVRHGDDFGFMGLFIVKNPRRGKGLGTQLWFARRDRLLSRLKEGATIGLDGVDAMVPFYEKGGFKPFTLHRRFQLPLAGTGLIRSQHIAPIAEVDLSILADYDRQCFPVRRERFLAEWTTQLGTVSLAYMSEGKLLGFGVMRPCLVGWKIGPLFSDDIDIADALFQSFQLESQGKPIFLDAPDNNASAIALCNQSGMKEVFGCARMYHGPAPELDHRRIFGVTTLEVG